MKSARHTTTAGWPAGAATGSGRCAVSTRFPLGLVRHSLLLSEQKELLVLPRLGTLHAGCLKLIREHEAGSQRMSRRGLLEADFYGLREWRPGDSRRWIHWRTSARKGRIVVRQFEQRRSQNLALLVDLWQPADPSDEDLARVETAVSLVATLIAEACRVSGRGSRWPSRPMSRWCVRGPARSFF